MKPSPTLRIAHVDTGPSLRGGQRQMLMLARGLRECGHEQVVVCLEGSSLEERAQREGIAVSVLRGNGAGLAAGTEDHQEFKHQGEVQQHILRQPQMSGPE